VKTRRKGKEEKKDSEDVPSDEDKSQGKVNLTCPFLGARGFSVKFFEDV
jgi:hypothetical protein